MDDDEFEDEDSLVDFLQSVLAQPAPLVRRMRPLDLLVWGAASAASMLSAASDVASDLAVLLAGQCNYLEKQKQFEDAIRLDLEHINEGDN